MASPQLVKPIKTSDPMDALGILVVDLQSLCDRLGLRGNCHSLQPLLDAVEKRVFGPRTTVLLLGETAAIKRRFLERILGPNLGKIPEPSGGSLHLEHGPEPECTISLPQGLTAVMPLEQMPDFLARRQGETQSHWRQTVRLPNAALARGLAIIDTPGADRLASALQPTDGTWLTEAAEMSDCWILVLGAEHEFSPQVVSLLRHLPRPCERLDIVVEGAESLSGEARQGAREDLIEKLREHCGLEDVRLTLLASPSAEGEAGSFWNGRFATFQSVIMMRGREHWLNSARACVAGAIRAVGEEIHTRLYADEHPATSERQPIQQQETHHDLQQARLRLGERDLQALQARLEDLGLLSLERPRPTPSLVSAVIWPVSYAASHGSDVRIPPEALYPQPAADDTDEARPAHTPLAADTADGAGASRSASTAASTPLPVVPLRHAPPWRQGSGDTHDLQYPLPSLAVHAFTNARQTAAMAFAAVAKRVTPSSVGLHRAHAALAHTRVETGDGGDHSVALRGTPYTVAARNLSAAVTLLFKHDGLVEDPPPVRRRRRILWAAGMVAAAWLAVWAVWLRQPAPGASSPWRANEAAQVAGSSSDSDFEMPEFQSPVKEPTPLIRGRHAVRTGSREVIADPSFTDLGLARASSGSRMNAAEKAAAVRDLAPTRPAMTAHVTLPPAMPTGPDAAQFHRQGRHGFLGLGRVWHWVRRGDPVSQPEPAQNAY